MILVSLASPLAPIGKSRKPNRRLSYRPRTEVLEDRLVPATLYVDDDKVQNPSAGYTSIQAAVDAAVANDTIRVSPGTYNETVNVPKTLTILGAKAWSDASTRATVSGFPSATTESIVTGRYGFGLVANRIEVNGFVIQNSAGPGITTSKDSSGYAIRYNVIQNNIYGIDLASNGTYYTRVEYNLIRNNNAAGAETGSANGISSDKGLSNAAIQWNKFSGHDNSAIRFQAATGVTNTRLWIAGNTSTSDRFGINLVNTTYSFVVRNNISNVSSSNGSGIYLAGGVKNVTVGSNYLTTGGWFGIALINDGSGSNTRNWINANRTTAFGLAGILLGKDSVDNLVTGNWSTSNSFTDTGGVIGGGAGKVYGDGIQLANNASDNKILNNRATGNARDGIRAESTTSNNLISFNWLYTNTEDDAYDASTGSLTAGTNNTWTNNRGTKENVTGLLNNRFWYRGF